MGEVKRYDLEYQRSVIGGGYGDSVMVANDAGEWVKYDDHAEALATAITDAHDDRDTLRAEVERLRAGLSDERIGEIYRETFNSMPDRARSVEKTPPLVIEFGRRLLAEACGRKG